MTTNDWITILTILSGLIGVVWKQLKDDIKTAKASLEADIMALDLEIKLVSKTLYEHEEKNYYIRHNFPSVTQGLQNQMITENKHIRELIQAEMRHLYEKLSDTNKMIEKIQL